MKLTDEQASIAQAIDSEFQRLIKLGKTHATILGQMHDHLAGFKQLMDAGVMREAGDRYPGFFRFAKVLERAARGIQSGAIPIPGGRQAPSRQTDPLGACRNLAAAMDLRMRQLAEEGVPTQAIIGRITGHLVDLQKIWTSTTHKQLAILCAEYPGFHRFATLMEETTAVESQKSSRFYDGLPEPIDLELDVKNRILYWTDRGDPPRGNTVNRASIDNKPAEPEIVVTHLMEGIGIALDVPNDRMFVTDFARKTDQAKAKFFH